MFWNRVGDITLLLRMKYQIGSTDKLRFLKNEDNYKNSLQKSRIISKMGEVINNLLLSNILHMQHIMQIMYNIYLLYSSTSMKIPLFI